MAADSTNALTWYLALDRAQVSHLGGLRTWSLLQVGFDEKNVWVKGFAEGDLDTVVVRVIPHKKLFYDQDGRLFPRGSRLPARPIPSVLWSPIRAALPVDLPPRNSGLSAFTDSIQTTLIPAETEQPAVALWVTLPDLVAYAETAPAVRLQGLQWVIVAETHALILSTSPAGVAPAGSGLLPLPGHAFWQKGDWLLPAGLDTAFPVLDTLLNNKLNPDGDDWLFWYSTGTYQRVPKAAFEPLSVSSVRQSLAP